MIVRRIDENKMETLERGPAGRQVCRYYSRRGGPQAKVRTRQGRGGKRGSPKSIRSVFREDLHRIHPLSRP